MVDISSSRRLTLVVFAIALGLILAARGLGITTRVNAGLYDQFMNLAASRAPAKVTLLSRTVPVAASERAQIMQSASAANMAGVLWLGPADAPGQADIPLWVASRVALDPNARPGRTELIWQGQDGIWAWCRALMEHGIHRHAVLTQAVAGVEQRCVQTEIAERLSKPLPVSDFRIDFSPGGSHIPQLGWEQALSGDWLQELGEGRVLIVAPTQLEPRLATPLNDELGMVDAEYQAFALDTLLGERAITEPSTGAVALIVASALIASLLLMQWLPTTTGGIVSAILLLGAIAVSWLALYQWHIWLPVTETCAALLAGFVISAQSRRVAEESEVGLIERTLAGIVSRRIRSSDITQSHAPWDEVMRFLTQHLNLSRAILLELPAKKFHVTEIIGHGCSIEDIFERRRDCRRSPYVEAVEQQGPALMTRQFLQEPQHGHQEYLVPLRFAGELLGFWYATVDQALPKAQQATPFDLQLFADHTAELLARRRAAEQMAKRDKARISRWIPGVWPRRFMALNSASRAIEDRLKTLEKILNGLSRATLVFDLFGHLQLSNHAAEDLARREQVSIYSLSGLDILTQWCQISAEQAREVMRDVILNQESFDFPISGLELATPHVVHVQVIRSGSARSARTANTSGQPFEILGVLMECFDVSRLHQSHRWFRDMTQQFGQKVRNDLQAVSLAWARVREQVTTQRAADVISRRLDDAANSMTTIQDHIEQTSSWNEASVVPIDPRACVQLAIKQQQEAAQVVPVEVAVDEPGFIDLVFARHDELTGLVAAALKVLIDDAVAGTTIAGKVGSGSSEDGPVVTISLANEGYGMPTDHVQRVMTEVMTDRGTEVNALTALADRAHAVERWGASVEASAEVGVGFKIEINLQGLQL